jgi:hypothetical protein
MTDDPRTPAQRLADALGALAANAEHLACRCESPDCPATSGDDGRASTVSIHIVAPAAALALPPDPLIHGDGTPPRRPEPEPPATSRPPAAETEPPAQPDPSGAQSHPPAPAQTEPVATDTQSPPPEPEPAPPRSPTGVIIGGGIVPAPLLAELIRHGAKVRYVQPPDTAAEPQDRPSTALAEFVRSRDLTCRAPGCNRAADLTDIDHTIPWPTGPTHPSNTSCKCRQHHLLKTFWTGEGGGSDQQRPDGSVIWTTPAAVTYTTRPGAALFFPDGNITTAPPPTVPPPKGTKPPGNNLDNFKRKHTRTQDRERRINAERARNTENRSPF